MKRKITVTTGTRAEYGLLRPVIREINKSKKLDLFLIAAGMHLSKKFGYTLKEIQDDGFKISGIVNMVPKGNTNYDMSVAVADGIAQFSKLYKKIKPDINVILGDRGEPFASAIAAFHMNIPNAHVHGGDKSQAGLDEYMRHAITKISNIHFGVSKKSTQRIIKMGENPKHVFFTGSPGIDEVMSNNITTKQELEKKYKMNFDNANILLVQHPVTTQTQASKKEIEETLKAVVKIKENSIIIFPNSDAGHKEIFNFIKIYSSKFNFITTYPSIPRSDYLGLLKNCDVLVGNSSSGVIEGSYFNTPVINIGIRQKDRERGSNVIDVGHSAEKIFHAIKKGFKLKKQKKFKNKYIYGNGNSSKKITQILETIELNDDLIQKQINY